MPGPTLEKGVTETPAGTFMVRVMYAGEYFYVGTFNRPAQANAEANKIRALCHQTQNPAAVREAIKDAKRNRKMAQDKDPTPTNLRRKALVTRVKELEDEVAQIKAAMGTNADAN